MITAICSVAMYGVALKMMTQHDRLPRILKAAEFDVSDWNTLALEFTGESQVWPAAELTVKFCIDVPRENANTEAAARELYKPVSKLLNAINSLSEEDAPAQGSWSEWWRSPTTGQATTGGKEVDENQTAMYFRRLE